MKKFNRPRDVEECEWKLILKTFPDGRNANKVVNPHTVPRLEKYLKMSIS